MSLLTDSERAEIDDLGVSIRAQHAESAIRASLLHRPRRDEEDEPIVSADDAEGWGITFAWAVLAVILCAAVIGAFRFGALP